MATAVAAQSDISGSITATIAAAKVKKKEPVISGVGRQCR
jgi:hypothetical protein